MTYSNIMPEEIANANLVLTCIANTLAADGVIENPEVILDNYVVTIGQRGMFTRAFDKLMGWINPPEKGKREPCYYMMMKVAKPKAVVQEGE